MYIGTVKINGKVILAPMAGITDMPFRSLCKQMGASVVYTEMVSAKGLFYNNKNTDCLLRRTDEERPLAVQIFGREPLLMAEIAKKLEYDGFDIIDINMGCPAPKIVKNGEGSALMKEPALIGKIVNAVSKAVDIPVTVKIRKGFDAANVNAVLCAEIAEYNGAAAVAVHGRTRAQQYSGNADWEIIKEVKESVLIPVIGNGDVVDELSAAKMLKATNCDFVMVGRASCGNPWVFSEINEYLEKKGAFKEKPSLEEKKRAISTHANALCALKGEKTAVLEMRRHMSYYVKGLKGAGDLRMKINSVHSLAELAAILELLQEN